MKIAKKTGWVPKGRPVAVSNETVLLSGVSGEGNFSRPRSGREKFTSLRTEDLGVAWDAFDAFLVSTSPPSF